MTGRRESRAIEIVGCPACGAARGQPCLLRSEAERSTARGRLLIHGERRRAWQAWRDTVPIAVRLIGRTLVATDDDAYAVLAEIIPADAPRFPQARSVEVRREELRGVLVALTRAGLRCEQVGTPPPRRGEAEE